MKKTNRREFLQKSVAGLAGLTILSKGVYGSGSKTAPEMIDMVKLGNTGINVPRVALGTGSGGWKNASNQTRLGTKGFVELSQYAYDKGIRFFDTADMYGSHEYVREALKVIPRDKVSILTKVMVYDQEGWYQKEPFQTSLDRFRKELGTEYFDMFLLHCMVHGEWSTEYRKYMDEVTKAKEKGIFKTVGVSCHNFDAMKNAASDPWVDVLLARINNKGMKMDGTPEAYAKGGTIKGKKAKKGKAEAGSSCLPPGVLAGRVVTSPAILCR